jgi:HSP20 family molecular chaperone IbpA
VDADNIHAEHENGILRVTMPKKQELKPRTVKILKTSEKAKK